MPTFRYIIFLEGFEEAILMEDSLDMSQTGCQSPRVSVLLSDPMTFTNHDDKKVAVAEFTVTQKGVRNEWHCRAALSAELGLVRKRIL